MAKRRPAGDGMVRKREDGRWEGRIVIGHRENAKKALEQLPALRGCQVHTSVMLSEVDIKIFKKLGVDLTSEPVRSGLKLY